MMPEKGELRMLRAKDGREKNRSLAQVVLRHWDRCLRGNGNPWEDYIQTYNMIIIIDFKRKILTTPMYLTNKEG